MITLDYQKPRVWAWPRDLAAALCYYVGALLAAIGALFFVNCVIQAPTGAVQAYWLMSVEFQSCLFTLPAALVLIVMVACRKDHRTTRSHTVLFAGLFAFTTTFPLAVLTSVLTPAHPTLSNIAASGIFPTCPILFALISTRRTAPIHG